MAGMDRNTDQDWVLVDEVGGEARLRRMVVDFYERVFDDAMIGFLFQGIDREKLVDRQVEWTRAKLGAGDVEYTGTPIREAHSSLPIREGQFDRRHDLLREVLSEYDVPEHVQEAWLDLETRLRDLVLQTGAEARDAILDGELQEDEGGEGEASSGQEST